MSLMIEKNIPLPSRDTGIGERRRKYPFNEMVSGDSFLVNGARVESIRSAMYAYGKKHGKKFSMRKTDDGYRIWRMD